MRSRLLSVLASSGLASSRRALGMLGAVVVLLACSSETPESAAPRVEPGEGVTLPSGEVFTRQALLHAVGECLGVHLSQFRVEAAALAAATDTAEQQRSFITAMSTWQRLELMQVGPLAQESQPGGAGMRDVIYSWPLISPCGVDELVVSERYDELSSRLINVRGLGALEYLLFSDTEASACSATSRIIQDGSWAALDAATLEARRAAYRRALVADLSVQAAAADAAWNQEGSGFITQLSTAGSGSRYFRSTRLALNAVSDALFYIEWGTKDAKVGAPSGLTQCAQASCPELLESRYARRSKQHLQDNLRGFRALFSGCGEDGAGLGFDDFLFAVGAPEVATQIERGVGDSLAALDAIEEDDLEQALVSDLGSVHTLYAALKRITDLLRTQFVSVLDLELPRRVEGDND